jgi:hypothetical protein
VLLRVFEHRTGRNLWRDVIAYPRRDAIAVVEARTEPFVEGLEDVAQPIKLWRSNARHRSTEFDTP